MGTRDSGGAQKRVAQVGKCRREMSAPNRAKLSRIWLDQLRNRGFCVPTRLPAVGVLRPLWRHMDPSVQERDGDDEPVARAVCNAVQERAMEMCLFNGSGVECNPGDSVLRFGDCTRGTAHRDCVSLRTNYSNLQFVVVLRGSISMTFERRVTATRAAKTKPTRRRPVVVKAGTLIIFFGARYAHAVTASVDCVRVTGWVCRAGCRVIDYGGSVLVRGWSVE